MTEKYIKSAQIAYSTLNMHMVHIDGLERRISIANALELRLSGTNPSIYVHVCFVAVRNYRQVSNVRRTLSPGHTCTATCRRLTCD